MMIFNWRRNSATAAGFILILIFVALNGALVASANGGVSGFYTESIAITVDCDTARINLACTLMSMNSSLIHYPSPVNLNDSHLVNCLSVARALVEDKGRYFGVPVEVLDTYVQSASDSSRTLYNLTDTELTLYYTMVTARKQGRGQ